MSTKDTKKHPKETTDALNCGLIAGTKSEPLVPISLKNTKLRNQTPPDKINASRKDFLIFIASICFSCFSCDNDIHL